MQILIHRKTIILILSMVPFFALSVVDSIALAENIAPYFPLKSGNWWNYTADGRSISTTILPGTVTVNGVPTKVMQSSDGHETYFTNDANGVREHGEYYPNLYIEGAGTFTVEVDLSPPFLYAAASMTPGQTVYSSGMFYMTIYGEGSFYLEYSGSSTFESFETITVPFGTYETVKFRVSLRAYGWIGGEWFDMTVSQTNWAAKYVGVVKQFVEGETAVLTDTNLKIANLSVNKSGLPNVVVKGQEVTYIVSVINNGPNSATGVLITDNLPSGAEFISASSGCTELNGTVTCNVGNLSNGVSATVTIVVTPTVIGTITNTASVQGSEPDPNSDNNTTAVYTRVRSKAMPWLPLLLDD